MGVSRRVPANRLVFASLLELVSVANVLFGTDFPCGSPEIVAATIAGVGELGLEPAAVARIERGSALALLPALGVSRAR